MLIFVCLKQGKKYSSDYVNILRDMVIRNLQEGTIDRFICVTDDNVGLDEGIESIPLPIGLEGWWGKLYLFSSDLFEKGDRIVYFDLDTVITGRLDDIFAYKGNFAILNDFYHPERVGSAVMLWEGGTLAHIWDDWNMAKRPVTELGDQDWIDNYCNFADRLQDLYPDKFVSYKRNCHVAPPKDAAVICFHGIPRPHQVKGWVENFWKKGGYSSADYVVVCNTELDKVKDNIRLSSNLDLRWLEIKPETNRKIILCGGAPSIEKDLNIIRKSQMEGALIVGMNGSAEYLVKNRIYPDWMVMIDSREDNVRFLDLYPSREYFIASQCNPNIFNKLESENVTLFHIDIPNIGEYVAYNDKPIQAIGGGSTVGLMSMCIAYTQGYRDIHLYGYDSSYAEGEAHAYKQDQQEEIIEAVVNERKFKTVPWMVTQSTQFQDLANQLRNLGCQITVHGDGLLPYIAWCMSNQTTLEK